MNSVLHNARATNAICVLGAILGVLLFSVSLSSQGNNGRILGAVIDQTGGVVSGATITIIDKDRGVARTLTTDDAGEYNAPNLIPGTYIVRVEANGFKRLERQNVVLEVGKEIRVDLTVQPGEQTQSVTVTEAIPLVETTNATLGGTLNNSDINDLPLNGRNYQSLLALRPGVMLQPGGGPWTQSTNNIRPDESAWMVDGVINANFYDSRPIAGMSSPTTDGATILPIDAIQEFNLEENPKAEYGWKPGAVVNVGVKSGTNTLHGTAYAFGRDDSFNARNIFNVTPFSDGTCAQASCAKTPQQLEQFGGVVGGPIKKDKLFFFGGYEGLRSSIGNAFSASVPATGSGLGPSRSMIDAINGLIKNGVKVSPVSLALLGCPTSAATATTALPSTATCSGGVIENSSTGSTSYLSTFPNTNTSDNGVGKLDYHINNKNQLTGMLFIGNYSGIGEDHPQVAAAFANSMPIRVWSNVENWVFTPNSRWVNEARFGYNRMSFDFGLDPIDAARAADGSGLTGGAGYPVNTGVTTVGGLPDITIKGFAEIGGWRGRPFENRPDPYTDFQDDISYLRGKHSFKFGGEYTHIEADWSLQDRGQIFFGTNSTGGSLAFGGSTPLEDFFAGDPNQVKVLTGGAPVRTEHWSETAGFFQDDYRMTQKVTINLGLRYSYQSPFTDGNGLLGSFNPASGLVQQGVGGTNTLWKPDYKDFSPRIGFAWDVTGKGTTVVRGGGSIIYSSFNVANFFSQPGLQNTAPSTNIADVPTGGCTVTVPVGSSCAAAGGTTLTTGGTIQLATKILNSTTGGAASSFNWDPTITGKAGPVFPTAGLVPSCTAAQKCPLVVVDPNLTTPYVTNWTLDVQHAFTSNLSLEVGYVGNHGARLTGFRDINQIDPATGVRPYATQYPYLNFINQMSNDAISNYNSLQTTLTERTSHGFSFIAGYTYGHALDDGSLNRFGLLPQNSQDVIAEYASSDFDVRNRFTFTTSYDIPGKKGFGQLLEGWKLNAIVTVASAQPWTVNDYSDDISGSDDTADRWDFFGNPNDFKEGTISIPYCSGFGGTVTCTQVDSLYGQTVTLPSSVAAPCVAHAPDPKTLSQYGCFVSGSSVMVPPVAGTFGTMGRNIFRDNGFRDVDFSIFKNFTFKERYTAQFRVEVFNLFNWPTIANPYGASNGGAGNGYIDPSVPNTFGCGCSTPDFIAGSPIVSSGDSRVMQLGLKLVF
jgi:carboxypeptidase family protein